MNDKRHHSRIGFAGRAVFTDSAGNKLTGTVIDISMCGLLVDGIEASLTANQAWTARIDLESGASVAMDVVVAHQNGDRVGFRCERIDMDDFCHLKRLVELNLGDPELLERELEYLG